MKPIKKEIKLLIKQTYNETWNRICAGATQRKSSKVWYQIENEIYDKIITPILQVRRI